MDVGVLLIGWDRPEPVASGHSFARIHVDELSGLNLDGWGVLVLGDLALEATEPRDLVKMTLHRRVRVLLAPDRCSGRRLVGWLRARFGELITPDRLPALLEDDRPPRQRRPAVSPGSWLLAHPDTGTEAERATAIVPSLPRPFSVHEWSAALGWNRQRLWRVCQGELGASPKTLLDRYIAAVVHQGRGDGMSWHGLARTLGFSDGAALQHNLHRGAPRG